MNKEKEFEKISKEIENCQKCPLFKGRTKTVPGSGNLDSEVVFIGEGPGFHEDQQGKPFVGAAGKFLDNLLRTAGFKREDVFIGNVVKCRPSNNRDPEPGEIKTCTENYLWRQITIIGPRLIVTLGRFSLALFLPGFSISDVHGQPKRRYIPELKKKIVILPSYHPAVGLYRASMKKEIKNDFEKIPKILNKLKSENYEKRQTKI